MMDPDYTGPIYHTDPEEKASYLTIDNTKAIDLSFEIQAGSSDKPTIITDLAKDGSILRVEVLW